MKTSLSKISHSKKRSSEENDPTASSMTGTFSMYRGLYFKPYADDEGCVYLRAYEKRVLRKDVHQSSRPIGKQKGPWIYFNEEKQRTSQQAFDLRFNSVVIKAQSSFAATIHSELEKIASPFDLSRKDSEYLGLFFDGTGAFLGQSETNVHELYNIYDGNKFYYGGIGNPIEYNRHIVKGALGLAFDENIKRAIADVKDFFDKVHRKPKIQLFGFSRGAAQANELATELKKLGIDVDLLLMIDPVYSVGKPGQGSAKVHTSPLGKSHNYVEARISDNVRKSVVLYADHETRVWFPATKFSIDREKTELIAGSTPGNHCDAGGFWSRNGEFQYVSLYWILEKTASGIAGDPLSGNLAPEQWQRAIDTRLKEITGSPQSQWGWSEIDWYYAVAKSVLSGIGRGMKELARKRLGEELGELLGEHVSTTLFGDQQDVPEIPRRFDTFGYPIETMRDWLANKKALPHGDYDYVSKPLPLLGETSQDRIQT